MADQAEDSIRRTEPVISPVPPPVRGGRPLQAPPRISAPLQSVRPPHRQPACGCVEGAGDSYGALWWARIPGRLWTVAVALTSPLRALALIMDMMVSAAVLGVLATVAAWWIGRIPDEDVARVLGEIGKRGLAIVVKSGVLGG
jgi:hypothetical protein